MTTWVVAAIAAIACLAASTLSLTGFGFALVFVPLASMVWEVKPVIAVSTILWTSLTVPLLFEVRGQIKFSKISPLLIGGICAIPGGIILIHRIDPDHLQIMIASIAIAVAIAFYLVPRIRLERPRTSISLLIGAIAGFVNASMGMGGPPLVLYILSFEREIEGMRSTILPIFFATGVMALIGFAITGIINEEVLIMAGLSVPAVGLGAAVGAWLRRLISASLFRTVTLTIIVITSTSALVSASGLVS